MSFKCKIREVDITYGPKQFDINPLLAFTIAGQLMAQGYRKTSNAYCMISRIDREDWLDVLAKERRCSRADFYDVDGSGVRDNHRDYYVRVHSKDNLTVSPAILRHMKSYW